MTTRAGRRAARRRARRRASFVATAAVVLSVAAAVVAVGVIDPRPNDVRAHLGVQHPTTTSSTTTPTAAFTALRGAGVDVVTMANNHVADYGAEGIRASIDAARAANFPIVGVGDNAAQAFAPWRTEIRGQRIAIFAATNVFDGGIA